MEEAISHFLHGQHLLVLLGVIAIFICTLAHGAHLVVEEAVILSIKWGVPKAVIGATIVSLGTTLPEAAVSVFAAIQGNPGLALGNAVGSIICDTGLIMGLAIVIGPVSITRSVVAKQGVIDLAAGFLLVLACLPFSSLSTVFSQGGRLPQVMGFIFLGLLAAYLFLSVYWTRNQTLIDDEVPTPSGGKQSKIVSTLVKLFLGIAIVVVSSQILIPTIEEVAVRLHVPDAIIAATLVAFGTSLPELVTAISAVRKRHGELAVGNVIGADILNVLFVAGAAASVTGDGLTAPASFFQILFPGMIVLLTLFLGGLYFSTDSLKRPLGYGLLLVYVTITVLSYTFGA
jgi:cation:H+ antiporter